MMESEAYLDTETFANCLVDRTIKEAVKFIRRKKGVQEEAEDEEDNHQDIQWPSNEEFEVEMGFQKLQEFVSTWSRSEAWLFCIDFVEMQMDSASDYYIYEVKWSTPSNSFPIPHAVASVFFSFEVSRIKPAYYPVEVKFVLEGSQFVHRPGKTKFNQQWLIDLLESKTRFYKSIRF